MQDIGGWRASSALVAFILYCVFRKWWEDDVMWWTSNQWDSRPVCYGIQSASCQSLREPAVKACHSPQTDSFRGGYNNTRSEASYFASSQCDTPGWEGQVVYVVLRPMNLEMHSPKQNIRSWIFPEVNCLFRSKSRSFRCLKPWETGRSAFFSESICDYVVSKGKCRAQLECFSQQPLHSATSSAGYHMEIDFYSCKWLITPLLIAAAW